MSATHSGVREMWELVGRLGDQLEESFGTFSNSDVRIELPVARIVVFGMGGSAAAAELMRGCFSRGPREIRVVRDYTPDLDLRDGDLALFSSYSGNTEEVLSSYDVVTASAFDGPRLVFSSGGDLTARANADGVPSVSIPGGLPPRASLGHGVGLFCGLLGRLGWIDGAAEIASASAALARGKNDLGLAGDPRLASVVQQRAVVFAHRLPVFYSGTALTEAVSRRWRAQWNENAKMLVAEARVPELDHNEIVGWEVETAARNTAVVVALRDPAEHERVKRRFDITREVLGPQVPAWEEFEAAAGPQLASAMALVQWGDALSVVLADLHGVDPMPVVAIDRLKRRLDEAAD